MKGHNIIEPEQLSVYSIPAYLRKGRTLQPNPTNAVVHHLDPEDMPEEPEEPETPPSVAVPPIVPKPEKGEGEENTQNPPEPKKKRYKSTISFPDKPVDVTVRTIKTNYKTTH